MFADAFLRRPALTMKLLKPTYLLRTLLLLCAVAAVSSACERNEAQSLSDKLDHMIANRQVYDCRKEQRIAELRHLLSVSGLTPAQEYEINDRLFGEFHKYKLDSAIRYTERNVLLARRLCDRRKVCLSGIRLAELYSSTGMSIEAKRMLDSIDRRSVPRDMLATYYKAYNRFYQQYVAFSGQKYFRELEERYQDSVIMVADTASGRYKLDLLGGPTIENGTMRYRLSDMLRYLAAGADVVLDEGNTIKPECADVLHSLTDAARQIQVPGYGLVQMHPHSAFTITMNEDYAGTNFMNEATIDRFTPIHIAEPESIVDVLHRVVPEASAASLNICDYVYCAIRDRIRSAGGLEPDAMTIRGFIDALRAEPLLGLRWGLLDNVASKPQDAYTRLQLTELIESMVPQDGRI